MEDFFFLFFFFFNVILINASAWSVTADKFTSACIFLETMAFKAGKVGSSIICAKCWTERGLVFSIVDREPLTSPDPDQAPAAIAASRPSREKWNIPWAGFRSIAQKADSGKNPIFLRGRVSLWLNYIKDSSWAVELENGWAKAPGVQVLPATVKTIRVSPVNVSQPTIAKFRVWLQVFPPIIIIIIN